MNFEDEPYVRLYKRKTLTSKLLKWEGRVVLRMMLDEFDEAGVFEIRGDAAACISAVTELPIEIVRTGLERLVETETWVVAARAIVWPRHEYAQHCQRSDRMRQQESRRARAARALTSAPAVTDVTPDASAVTDVTEEGDRRDNCHPPILSSHPTHPERERERAREEENLPEVPGLAIVHPGPLGASRRERDELATLTERGNPRHEYTPGWTPIRANQARGHELGLSDEEIWARWETCKDKHYEKPFRSDAKQFNRELAFAAQDKTTARFRGMSKAERGAFELPGKERRA